MIKLANVDNRLIYVVKEHAPRYFSASLLTALLGLVVNKYFTVIFSIEKYGELSIYLTVILYLQGWMALGVESAWQRCYFDYLDNKGVFLGTVVTFCAAFTGISSFVIVVIGDMVIDKIGGNECLLYLSVAIAAVGVYLKFINFLCINENISSLLQKQTMLQAIVSNGAAVGFILLGCGVWGILVAKLIAVVVNAYCFTKKLFIDQMFRLRLGIDWQVYRAVKPFAISFFLTAFITTSLSYLDRVLLVQYHGVTSVGLFSLGIYIGQGLNLITDAVISSVIPSFFRGLNNNYLSGIQQVKRFDCWWHIFLFMVFVLILFFKNEIVVLFSSCEYSAASVTLPMICLGYIAGAGYKVVINVLNYHKMVRLYPFIAGIAYVISAVINIQLVPYLAETGAAIAFFVGNLVYSFCLFFIARKVYVPFLYAIWYHFFLIGIAVIVFLKLEVV